MADRFVIGPVIPSIAALPPADENAGRAYRHDGVLRLSDGTNWLYVIHAVGGFANVPGDLLLATDTPELRLMSPTGVHGWRVLANLNDSDDFGLQVGQWNGATFDVRLALTSSGIEFNGQRLATDSAFSGALVRLTANQSIPHNTNALLGFGDEVYDIGSYHSNLVNNSRVVCPTDGIYVTSASATYASNATGFRVLRLLLNGASFPGRPVSIQTAVSGNSMGINCDSAAIFCSAGDYFEAQAFQTSGAALDIVNNDNTWFAIRRLADLS